MFLFLSVKVEERGVGLRREMISKGRCYRLVDDKVNRRQAKGGNTGREEERDLLN